MYSKIIDECGNVCYRAYQFILPGYAKFFRWLDRYELPFTKVFIDRGGRVSARKL